MEQFIDDPCGGTGLITAQNEQPMATGWRKATTALMQAEHLSNLGKDAAVEKGRAVVAVKRVGAHLGLKAADLLLLDTLCAFSQKQDWEAGQCPIVWPSNALLMEQTGLSLSSVKRHARKLVEAGLIAYRDSPNGKRWGRRDKDGLIVEAYGFDLSPMAARAPELEDLGQQIATERSLCQRMKRQITIHRRSIRARLQALAEGRLACGGWSGLQNAFDALLTRLSLRVTGSEALSSLLCAFATLEDRINQAFSTPNDTDLDPTEVIDEPHILTTQINSDKIRKGEDPRSQKKETPKKPMKFTTVLEACPQFTAWARDLGNILRNWSDLHQTAAQLGPMIGVSERIWARANAELGAQAATTALVLVFDKHCTGEVKSPGGYLRGMIEKAQAGALHLDRSFYGRLSNGRA